jgi:hypothetical protein
MKKQVFTIFVILTLSSAYNVYAQIVSAADFWYPGDIGTSWIYEMQVEPFVGFEPEVRLAETRQYGDREYKVVEEIFPGIIADPFNPDPDPFLVFREDASGSILGYGVEWNENFEEELRGELIGLGARDISFQWTSDEWTLLIESPGTGAKWTVWEVRVSFTYLGTRLQEKMWMEGSISREQRLSVRAGEFDTFVVDYIGHDEVEGVEVVKPFPIESLWLAPDVGMVQFTTYEDGQATVIAELAEYEQVVPPPSPNDPPEVEILSPIEGDVLSEDHEIRWTATDPDEGDEVESLNIQYGKDTGPWINIPFDGVNDGSVMWATTAVPDGSYKIRIIASDSQAETTATSDEFTIDNTPPSRVSNLTGVEHQVRQWSVNGQIRVIWSPAVDAGAGLGGYSIAWDTVPDTVLEPVKDMEEIATSASSIELASGDNYYFHIRAVDNAGNWGETEHLGPFYIDKTLPGEGTELSSHSHKIGEFSSDDTVDVAWTAADDWGSGLKGYSVVWDINAETLPDETQDMDGTVTGLSSERLSEGVDHYFHVRSVDNVGNWSATATHLGPFWIDTTPPTLVSNLTSPSHNPEEWSSTPVVQLTWESGTDALSGLKGYSVLWDENPDTTPDDTVEAGADVTSYAGAELADGNTHYFHVRSVDNSGNASGEAAHAGPFYIDTAGPELVTGLVSSSHQVDVWSNDDTVDVQWVSAVDEHSGLDGYSVSWDDTVPDDVKAIEEDAVALTSPELVDGTSFYFRIRGVDSLGNWSADARLGPFLIDTIKPSEVADLNITTHNISEWSSIQVVKVTWTSAQDDESGLDGYSALWDTSPDTTPEAIINMGADVTETESQQLADGDSFYFHLRSADKAGNWSDTATHLGPFYVDATPPILDLPIVEEIWSNENVVSNVEVSAADELSGLKGYSVVWDEIAGTEPEEIENAVASETITSPELADGKWYLHAKASDNAGNWSATSHSGPFMIDITNIQPPGDLASDTHIPEVWNGENVIEVKWTPAVDNMSGLSGYSVVWDNQPDAIPDMVKELEADAVSITSPELPDGDNHWFHIRAIDNAGNGDRGELHLGPFYVDSSAPGTVANLTSPSVGRWTTDNVLKLEWEPAMDTGVGLGGYSVVLDSAADTMPPTNRNLGHEATDWTSEPLADGAYYFHIRAVDQVGTWSDSAEHRGPFLIDTTPPTVPANLRSTSHSVRTWSRQNTVNVSWQGSSDGMSGVAGYSVSWDNLTSAVPDETAALDGSKTSAVSSRLFDSNEHYFHVRAADEAGNWSNVANLGPFYVDSTPPANVRVQKITQDSDQQYTHLVGTNLYYSASGSAAFTVYVSAADTGSGMKEALFPDCVCPGATVTDESSDPGYSYSYQYKIAQTSSFDGRAMVTVYDNAGNSGTASFNVTYDNVGPGKPTNLRCDNGAEWNTTGEVTITWGGEGDDKSGVVDYYVEPDNEEPEKNPSGGKQTITLSVDDAEQVTFYVRGMDKVGNWGEAASATIGVDTKAPDKVDGIEHSDSDANSGYDNDKQLDFSWQAATDNIKVDHYEVHLSVDGGDYELHESTDKDSYTLSASDGESCSIKVVAVDAAGNKGDMSEPSESIICDATMPGFTVAMIPNPGFYNFMDIGIVCSEKLLEEPPSLSVDLGGTVEVQLKNVAENVWVGSYIISGDGIATLTVSGTDLAGNEETDTSNSFSAQTVLAKAPAPIESADGKLNLDIPSGAFDKDTIVTITPVITNTSLIQNLEGAELAPGLNELEPVGGQYLIWPKDANLLSKATLSMRYEGKLSGKRVCIYRWNGAASKWEYVDSSVDGKSGTVSATTGRFGVFGLYIVPLRAVIPEVTELLQNYPNPFNPETWIPYKLSVPAEVELRIYGISGQLVRALRLGQCKPGTYTDKNRAVYWDGKNENGEAVSSGIYFYHLTAGKSVFVRKMVVAQ